MRKVLLVTSSKFWRHQNGAASRISSLVFALQAAGYEVGLFFVGLLGNEDHCQLNRLDISNRTNVVDGIALQYSDFFSASPSVWCSAPRYLLKLWYRFRKINFPFKEFYNSRVLHGFEDYLVNFNPDIVLVEYVQFSFLLPKTNHKQRLWVIDTHDVMYKRCAKFKKLALPHWVEISRDEEVDALMGFDAVIAIQKDEEKLLRNMVKSTSILLVPHSVDVSILPILKRNSSDLCVGYLAANNPVNYDAITWFLDRVWPACVELLPSVRLRIGGNICGRLEGRFDPNVELVGYIKRLSDFYSETDVIINPVRSGGGLKIKNVEALAMGRPLVTTPVGADGFPNVENQPFVVVFTEQEFVAELTHLLRNEKRRNVLRNYSLKYVNDHFSRTEVYKSLVDFINERQLKIYSNEDSYLL